MHIYAELLGKFKVNDKVKVTYQNNKLVAGLDLQGNTGIIKSIKNGKIAFIEIINENKPKLAADGGSGMGTSVELNTKVEASLTITTEE